MLFGAVPKSDWPGEYGAAHEALNRLKRPLLAARLIVTRQHVPRHRTTSGDVKGSGLCSSSLYVERSKTRLPERCPKLSGRQHPCLDALIPERTIVNPPSYSTKR